MRGDPIAPHAGSESSTRLSCRTAAALLPAMVLPFAASLFYFVLFSDHPAARVLYAATKVFTVLWPWVALRFILREPFPGPVAGVRRWVRALPLGALVGALVVAAFAVALRTGLGSVVDGTAGAIGTKARQLGILDHYWAFALFLSLANSLVEEYYWRWFLFGRLRLVLPRWPSHLVAAAAFAAHHAVVTTQFLPLGWGLAAAAAVALGGLIMSTLYERQGTVAGAWACHLLADLGIMGIGYRLLF
jgi:uncharacterized protein